MRQSDIDIQDAARKYLESIVEPLTEADIIDAFIEGAYYIINTKSNG